MISRRRFYAVAIAIVIGMPCVGACLTFVLPYWFAVGVAMFIGVTVGSATAHVYFTKLLPPDE